MLCMVDSRQNLTEQVANEVRTHFGGKVFTTTIPRNVRLSEAPSFGKPILLYDIASKGAKSYLDLARELLARDAGKTAAPDAAATAARMSAPKRNALGRGLAALIPGAPPPSASGAAAAARLPSPGPRRRGEPLAVEEIHPSPGQPRHALRRRAARGAGGVDPRAGDHPAADRARPRPRAAATS